MADKWQDFLLEKEGNKSEDDGSDEEMNPEWRTKKIWKQKADVLSGLFL